MTRAYNTATTQQNSGGAVTPFAAGKNKIINGSFNIWQRGTSFTPSAGVVTFTADRWRSVVNSGTTISRQTFTPGTAPVAGYESQYYWNATVTANNQNYEHGQFIEDARTFAGQTVTLSFWARSTVGAQPLNVAMYQNFGTGGSPSGLTQVGSTVTYTPTSSWQRFTFTFNVPSVSGKTFGTNNDSYLWVRTAQYTTTATNTSVDIWGVQLEAGSVATAFQTATGTIQGELAACQRYLPAITTTAAQEIGSGMCLSSTQPFVFIPFQVPARVAPTGITATASNFLARQSNGASTPALSAISFNSASPIGCAVLGTTSSLTQGNATTLQINGTILFTGCEL